MNLKQIALINSLIVILITTFSLQLEDAQDGPSPSITVDDAQSSKASDLDLTAVLGQIDTLIDAMSLMLPGLGDFGVDASQPSQDDADQATCSASDEHQCSKADGQSFLHQNHGSFVADLLKFARKDVLNMKVKDFLNHLGKLVQKHPALLGQLGSVYGQLAKNLFN